MFYFLLFFAVIIGANAVTTFTPSSSDRILLQNVKILIFEKNKLSTSRRSAPVHQLNCVKGCGTYEPSKVVCHNAGSNGIDVQWKCEASLPKQLKLGKVEVNCEGYDSPIDKHILAGSCGLEYELEYNETFYSTMYKKDENVALAIFCLFVFVFVLILLCAAGAEERSRTEMRNRVRQNVAAEPGEEGIHHDHHYTAAPPPPVTRTVYVEKPSSTSAFTEGVILGSMMRSTRERPVPFPEPVELGYRTKSFVSRPISSSSSSSSSDQTETSTSYGGTKRR